MFLHAHTRTPTHTHAHTRTHKHTHSGSIIEQCGARQPVSLSWLRVYDDMLHLYSHDDPSRFVTHVYGEFVEYLYASECFTEPVAPIWWHTLFGFLWRRFSVRDSFICEVCDIFAWWWVFHSADCACKMTFFVCSFMMTLLSSWLIELRSLWHVDMIVSVSLTIMWYSPFRGRWDSKTP